MKKFPVAIVALTMAFSVSAFAQFSVETDAQRDQVNLHARNNYPAITFKSTKTRSEVVAELADIQKESNAEMHGAKSLDTAMEMQHAAKNNMKKDLFNGDM